MAIAEEEAGFRRTWRKKASIGQQPWPQRPHNPTPAEVARWLRRYLPASFHLLGWYREVLDVLYGRQRPFEAMVSIPRGNGKTTFAAALSLFELFGRGRHDAQVLHLATTQMQARICYDAAVRMVEQVPELWSRAALRWVGGYERLIVRETGSFMMALPTQRPRALQGYTPSLAVVDEVGFIDEKAWAAMAQATVKQHQSQVLGIGTPGFDESGLMYRMRSRDREQPTPGFSFLEWSAPAGCELRDKQAWRVSNPALGTVKSERAMAALIETSAEEDFRTFQLGQWVGRAQSWLPTGVWSALERQEAPPEGTTVCLGFDGSASYDSTALCWAAEGAVGAVQVWERPGMGNWKVPREAVLDTIRWAFGHWNVRALYADPWGWRRELQELEREFGPERIIEFPTTPARIVPAIDRFQVAVLSGRMAHDHDATLARHIQNAAVRRTAGGLILDKPDAHGSLKIDAAIAAILAYQGLEQVQPEPVYSERVVW